MCVSSEKVALKGEASETLEYGTRPSRWIAGPYWAILPVLAVMFIGVPFFAEMTEFEGTIFYLFSLLLLVPVYALYKLYSTRYLVNDTSIVIKGATGTRSVPLAGVKAVMRTLTPLGVRLYGITGLGGWYHIPGFGRTWVAITNFTDAVLIDTEEGKHFLVTPDEPDGFVAEVKRRAALARGGDIDG